MSKRKKIEKFGQSIKKYDPSTICNYLQIQVGKDSEWVD